jgi:hypothetical protein
LPFFLPLSFAIPGSSLYMFHDSVLNTDKQGRF